MPNATRVLLLIASLSVGLGACASRVQVVHRSAPPNEPAPTTQPAPPNEPAPPPSTGVPVEVTIASATLGDDCPAPPTADVAADVAPSSSASLRVASDAPAAGSPAHGRFAAGFCQRTGLQLSVTAPEHHPGGSLEVLEVRLLSMDSAPLGTLEVRGRTLFQDGQYVAWDGNVAPGQQNVSLHTSGPDWASLGGNNGYGQSFRMEVDVRVGGETRTLELSPVSREPMVVT